MADKIKDIEVYLPKFNSRGPYQWDATMILKGGGSALVRVITEDGVEGWGSTYGEPIGEYVMNILKEEVIGKDPLAYEDIWNAMHIVIRSSGRKGIALLAMSAIDLAIWDIRGKILGLPVYRLIGGTKNEIPCYASVGFLSMTDEECAENSIEFVKNGFTTLKYKVGYDWGTNIRADIKRIEKQRAAVGMDVDIVVDANGAYDAMTAIRFAQASQAAGLDICLFEEPVPADDIPGLKRVRDHSGIAVATAENEYTKYGARDLILAECVDVIQFDMGRVGGFTEMVKINAIAEAWNLRIAPHSQPQFSAHALSPAAHGLWLEVFPSPKAGTALGAGRPKMSDVQSVSDGIYRIPEVPGFGIEYNLDFLKDFKANYN